MFQCLELSLSELVSVNITFDYVSLKGLFDENLIWFIKRGIFREISILALKSCLTVGILWFAD